jgi:hypothetical protein
MKRLLTIGVLAALTTLGLPPGSSSLAHADTADRVARAAETLRERALQSSEAYALVTALTTEVGPRAAGTSGDAAAVAWSRATLSRLGFSAIRTPEVIVPRWIRGEASFEVLAPYPQPMPSLAIGGSIGTSDEGLSGELVMVENIADLQALPAGAVKGKVVFFNGRMERTRDTSGYSKAVRARTDGPSAAASLGATGVVLRSIGTSRNRFPHTGTLSYNISAPRIPALAISTPDADTLERQFATGRPVVARLRITARDLPQARSANVIADIPGTDLANEIVLIGAHLDSWDAGTGALDDGAGVAIAIAAARLAAGMEPRPRRTLRVVLFANEEFGLSGANSYPGDEGPASVERHVLAMEADLGAGPVFRLSAQVAETNWPLIERMHRLVAPLGVELGGNKAAGGADLGPLRRRGVPVLAPELDATRYFDVHHTANDTLDQVDPAALRQSVAVFAVSAYLAAMEDGPMARLPVDPAAR